MRRKFSLIFLSVICIGLVFGNGNDSLPVFDSVASTSTHSRFVNAVSEKGIFIQVTVSGVPLKIMFDTGFSSGFALTENAAKKANVQVKYRNYSNGKTTGKLSNFWTGKIPDSEIRIGQLTLAMNEVAVAGNLNLSDADGVIGIYDLKNFKIDIQPDSRPLSIDSVAAHEPDAKPMTKNFIRSLVMSSELDGIERSVLLDTGNLTACNTVSEAIPMESYFHGSPAQGYHFTGYFPYIFDVEGQPAKVTGIIQTGTFDMAGSKQTGVVFFQSNWGVGQGIDANVCWKMLQQCRIVLNLVKHEISFRPLKAQIRQAQPKGYYLINTDHQVLGIYSNQLVSPEVLVGDELMTGYEEYLSSVLDRNNRDGFVKVKLKRENRIFEANLYTGYLFPRR